MSLQDDHPARMDAVFRALADADRRRVLAALRRADGPLPVETLARDVVDDASAASPPDRVQSVEIALHHVHLPLLAEAGLVAYDVDERSVRLAGDLSLPESLAPGDPGR